MALDPTMPDPTGAAELRDLRRRIEALERANKLVSSSIVGGRLEVRDEDGVLAAELGDLNYGETGFHLMLSDGIGPLLQVDQGNGFGIPWMSSEWQQPTDAALVTSGAFVSTWTTLTELLFSINLLFRVTVLTDVGTTGELRITNVGNQIGGIKTVPSGTSAQYEYRIAHGLTMGTGPFVFALEAQRTGGAGNFFVYHPKPLHYGSNMVPNINGWV